MTEVISKAQLIVMVSHDLDALAKFCSRVLWMDHGRVRQDGPTAEVLAVYTAEMESSKAADTEKPSQLKLVS